MANPFDLYNVLSNYPGRDRIQELQNIDFKNNPRDTATGPPSDFRHAAAMNELSKSLSPGFVPDVVGDSLAYGLGSINEIPDAFRGFSFTEGFDPKAMADAKEDFSANYDGTFGTPNTATIEDVFANTLGYEAPGTNVVRQTASTGPLNYGTAQAAEISPTTNKNFNRDFSQLSRMGDAISRPNIQSENYNMDQSFYMNPNSVERPQNMFQRAGNAMHDGIGSIRDFAVDKGMSAKNLLGSGAAIAMGLPGIVGSTAMSLLGGFGNMFEDRQLSGDGTIVDEYGRSYNASDLNKQNALGGYYTDAARGSRRRGKSIQTMLARQTKEGLSRLGEKRLAKLQAQEALQEQSRQAAARQMQDSNRANNTGGYQAGYSSDFMEGPAPGASNQDLTSTMGSFRDGGLASMFVRRR